MRYRFVRERTNYEDYASGRVLVGMPGNPAFPVRLASEVLQRCAMILESGGRREAFCIYDPCCGAAYHLAVIGYLHMRQVQVIIGSDIDEAALTLAARNLGMLSLAGLEQRMAELAAMRDAFGKRSHTEALASAARLLARLTACPVKDRPRTRLFRADATDRDALVAGMGGQRIDIVFADVPYGWRSEWQSGSEEGLADGEPLWLMLESLLGIVSEGTVLAIAADKSQRVEHERYARLQRLRAGKRQIAILKPLAGTHRAFGSC
jgi:23S rRNA (guanine2535-N1)-methyltransferase